MTMLPAFKAVLDSKMSDQQCAETLETIRGLKGVLGAHFTKASRPGSTPQRAITVTYNGNGVRAAVKALPAVRELRRLL